MSKKVKENAKEMLRTNWGTAIVMTFVIIAVMILVSLLEGLVSWGLGLPGTGVLLAAYLAGESYAANGLLLSMALTALCWILFMVLVFPLVFGLVKWCYNLSFGAESDGAVELFAGFASLRTALKSIGLYCCLAFCKAVITLLMLVPGVFMMLLSTWFTVGSPTALDEIMATMGAAIGICLVTLAIPAAWICCKMFSLAPCIMCAGKNVGVVNAIKTSIKATKGYRTAIAKFQLSFFGWWVSCIFVLPLFYVLPYTAASNTLLARTIMQINSDAMTR